MSTLIESNITNVINITTPMTTKEELINNDNINNKKRKLKQQWQLRDLSSMRLLNVVGDGTYGTVFSATDKETNELIALKKIKMELETQGFPVTAIREIKILKSLQHENVIQLKEIVTYEKDETEINTNFINTNSNTNIKFNYGDVFMVFEYAEFDLAGLINEVAFTKNHIKSYMYQLMEGINYMHHKKIMHRDIKGANILITADNKLKIADLGLARSYIATNDNR